MPTWVKQTLDLAENIEHLEIPVDSTAKVISARGAMPSRITAAAHTASVALMARDADHLLVLGRHQEHAADDAQGEVRLALLTEVPHSTFFGD